MRHYTFQYIDGSSAPYKTLDAEDDLDFYRQLARFLGNTRKLIAGSIHFTQSGQVADPSGIQSAA